MLMRCYVVSNPVVEFLRTFQIMIGDKNISCYVDTQGMGGFDMTEECLPEARQLERELGKRSSGVFANNRLYSPF